MVESPEEFIDRSGTEGVTHLGPVEGDAYGGQVADDPAVRVAFHLPVVGDVLEIEALHDPPTGGVEEIGYLGWEHVFNHAHESSGSTSPGLRPGIFDNL